MLNWAYPIGCLKYSRFNLLFVGMVLHSIPAERDRLRYWTGSLQIMTRDAALTCQVSEGVVRYARYAIRIR